MVMYVAKKGNVEFYISKRGVKRYFEDGYTILKEENGRRCRLIEPGFTLRDKDIPKEKVYTTGGEIGG